MSQNPLLQFKFKPQQENPLFQFDVEEDENPLLKSRVFDPTQKPEKNVFGKFTDPILQKGKTLVGTILEMVDKPQNAMQGALVEGVEGFKKGLAHEKDYNSTDVLDAYGWKGDGLGKKATGLALDLVADPLNLVGVGAVKKGYQAAVKGGAALAEKGLKATPGVSSAVKAVEKFIDPHADLKDVAGLKDYARLTESKARSVKSGVDQDVSNIFAKKKFGPLTKTIDDDARKRIAYAIDEDKLGILTPEEQLIANKFKKTTDTQFASELKTGHQDPASFNPNYVPYITKADNPRNINIVADVKGTTRHSKARNIPTLTEAVKNYGATDDAAEILRARLSSGRLAQEGADALEEAGRLFGKSIPGAGFRQLNMKNISVPSGRGIVAKNLFYPEKAADYLERAHAIYTKPDEVDTAIKNATKVYKSWLVTTPQQSVTNLVGNVVNAFMSGNEKMLRPDKLAKAGKIVIGKSIAPDIGKYKSADIMQAMKDYEVIGGQGQYHDIFSGTKNFSINPLKANNVAGKYSQYVNQHVVEEPFKVALYLQALEDGADLKQAALKVKDTFFDYAEVSDQAKNIRDYGLAPFITWQLKNIPMQVENLAMRPQKFAQTESMYDAVTDGTTVVPHQDEREGMLPIGPDKLMRFASPINDLNRIPSPVGYEGRDFLLDTIGSSMPWYKAALELPTNKKIYNDMPVFPKDDSGVVPFDWISRGLDEIGLGGVAGVSEGVDGYPEQNPLAAYILQQNPWNYYGRNIFSPPDELVDKGSIVPTESKLEKAGGLFGFRTKEVSPKAMINELKRKNNMMAK